MKAWMLPITAVALIGLMGCAGEGMDTGVRAPERADMFGTIQGISEMPPPMPGEKVGVSNGFRGRDWLTVEGNTAQAARYNSAIVTVDHETEVFRRNNGTLEPVHFEARPDEEPYAEGQTVEITFEPGSVVEATPVRARADKLIIVAN